MPMRKKLVILLSAAMVVAAATGLSLARPSDAASVAGENYGQYSLMFEKSAGQYWAGGAAAGQWAWTPLTATTSDISWGDPKAWPPQSA
jgi:hypothetical protein